MNLVFLSGNMCDPELQRAMKLPVVFVSFALLRGRLYRDDRVKDTFAIAGQHQESTEDVVYGAVFMINDFSYHIRTLDAYKICSLSTLRKNHSLDTQHRVRGEVTLISFNSVDELNRLKYIERGDVTVDMYVGNTLNNSISRYVRPRARKRIMTGIHKEPLLKLIREVL